MQAVADVGSKAGGEQKSAQRSSRQALTSLRVALLSICFVVFITCSWFALHTAYILHCWSDGHSSIVTHNYKSAEEYYRKAVVADAAVGKSHLYLASALLRESKLAQAIPELYFAADSDLTDFRVRLLLGDVLVATRNPVQAEQIYRQAIAISPKLAEAHVKLGGCLLNLHRAQDAVIEFQYATLLDPKNVKANTNLGFLLLANRQRRDGLTYLQRAVDAAPNDLAVRNNLAMEYVRARMNSQAAEEFRAEIAIDPQYAIAYFNLGNALKDMHNKRGAISAYQSYLRVCENNPREQVAVMRAVKELRALNSNH